MSLSAAASIADIQSANVVADCGVTAPYQRVAGQRAHAQLNLRPASNHSDAIPQPLNTTQREQSQSHRDYRGFRCRVMVSPNKGISPLRMSLLPLTIQIPTTFQLPR